MIKYLIWLFFVIAWNFAYPEAHPVYDVIMAILLKHIFDIYIYMKGKL